MHTDLSQQLHSSECVAIIEELAKCRSENKFTRFLGACNDLDTRLNKCLKKEREDRRAEHASSSLKARKERYEKFGK
ncbi:hypothetical protein EB796_009296 [Bugula neritina]|uniref:COX assembly mitochondrial protein n=1 Tax=Bugula neritina TaxID=10212 RepID=A0A7J7K0Z7_BUGNE|nr:hypothetical protein EB796_009868 [Bugula neritina]KAF6032400.1 hypothetical protein EB796_009296 [Bugula neritina]